MPQQKKGFGRAGPGFGRRAPEPAASRLALSGTGPRMADPLKEISAQRHSPPETQGHAPAPANWGLLRCE